MNCGIKAGIVSICEANSKGYVGTVTDLLAAGERARAAKGVFQWQASLGIENCSGRSTASQAASKGLVFLIPAVSEAVKE